MMTSEQALVLELAIKFWPHIYRAQLERNPNVSPVEQLGVSGVAAEHAWETIQAAKRATACRFTRAKDGATCSETRDHDGPHEWVEPETKEGAK